MSRYPVHCAFCLRGLPRWYYGGRAPTCCWCRGKEGPVRAPSQWEISRGQCSIAAREVWEAWARAERGAA